MLVVDSKKLHALLIERGLNFRDFARDSLLSDYTVWKLIQSDRQIQNKTAKKISDALNIPVNSIIKEDC